MKELIDIIANNGIAIVCVAYLIYFQLTTMKDISKNMAEVNTSLKLINDDIKELKSKEGK